MSSPVHFAEDLDPALMYAPRRVRDQARTPTEPPVRLVERFEESRKLHRRSAFIGDRAYLELQRKLSLDPDYIPEPPERIGDQDALWRIALRLCGVIAFAAAIATALALGPVKLRGHKIVQVGSFSTPTSNDLVKQDALPLATTRPETGTREGKQPAQGLAHQAIVNQTAGSDAALSTPQPSTKAVESTNAPASTGPDWITRRLEHDEVTSLLKRGRDFLTSGDLASARLVLLRAAEAGDREAALALAGTFDPNTLGKLGMQGMADVTAARLWYERAEQFGSAEAPRLLQQLSKQVTSAR